MCLAGRCRGHLASSGCSCLPCHRSNLPVRIFHLSRSCCLLERASSFAGAPCLQLVANSIMQSYLSISLSVSKMPHRQEADCSSSSVTHDRGHSSKMQAKNRGSHPSLIACRPTHYPIQYQLMAAPNATASDCTYVVTYPAPTQALANTLCSQGNTSCTNSPCQPCNVRTQAHHSQNID